MFHNYYKCRNWVQEPLMRSPTFPTPFECFAFIWFEYDLTKTTQCEHGNGNYKQIGTKTQSELDVLQPEDLWFLNKFHPDHASSSIRWFALFNQLIRLFKQMLHLRQPDDPFCHAEHLWILNITREAVSWYHTVPNQIPRASGLNLITFRNKHF